MAAYIIKPKTPHLSSSLFRIKTHFRSYIPVTTTTNNHDLESTIRARCLSGEIRLEEALFYIDSLAGARPLPSSSLWTLDYLLASLSKLGHHSAAVSRFRALSAAPGFRPRRGTLGVVLRCYCLLARPDLAFAVAAAMLKLALGPDARALSALIRALFSRGSAPEALRLFERLPRRLCDEFTYAVVIDGLCKAGDVAGATELLRRRIVPPDAACFGPVVDALCRAGEPDEALKLLDEMSAAEVPLNAAVATPLVRGLCRLGRWDEAKRYLRLCPGKEVYNAAIGALCDAGEWRSAVSAFESMLRDRVRPTAVSFTSFLCGLSGLGRCGEALQLFGVMDGLFGVRPNIAVFAAVTRALCGAGRTAEALGLVPWMAARGVEPNIVVYNHLIQGCFRSGKWREGFELAERVRAQVVPPNVVTFTVIAAGLCEQGRMKEAVSVFKDMVVRGLVPDRAARAVLRRVLAGRPGPR